MPLAPYYSPLLLVKFKLLKLWLLNYKLFLAFSGTSFSNSLNYVNVKQTFLLNLSANFSLLVHSRQIKLTAGSLLYVVVDRVVSLRGMTSEAMGRIMFLRNFNNILPTGRW